MRLVLIAVLSLWAAAAQATDLVPTQPLRHELDEDTSASIVYSAGMNGYRVVVTVQQTTEALVGFRGGDPGGVVGGYLM